MQTNMSRTNPIAEIKGLGFTVRAHRRKIE